MSRAESKIPTDLKYTENDEWVRRVQSGEYQSWMKQQYEV